MLVTDTVRGEKQDEEGAAAGRGGGGLSLSMVRWIITSDGIVEGIEGGGGGNSVSEHMVNVVVFELEDSVREPDLRGHHLHMAAEQGANPR